MLSLSADDAIAQRNRKVYIIKCFPVHILGPHSRQRFSTATAMCSHIAVAVAVDGLPTHAAADLFNFSAYTD